MKHINYRELAFEHCRHRLFCMRCGFGIPDVLEVAHLTGMPMSNPVAGRPDIQGKKLC
jgi:hypothetical protein